MNKTRPSSGSPFWSNRTVVVTGGNGFLGTHVVNKFRAAGAHVIAPRRHEADFTKYGVAEQLFLHGRADDAHFRRRADVGSRERAPFGDGPVADDEEILVAALNGRAPVGVTRHDLRL